MKIFANCLIFSVNAVTMGGEAHVRQETQAALEQLVKLSGTGPSHICKMVGLC